MTILKNDVNGHKQQVNDGAAIDVVGRDRMAVFRVGLAWTESAALHTVVQLGVPRILATQASPPHYAMSAQQLLQHMPGARHPNVGALENLLQLLACKGVLAEYSESDPAAADAASGIKTFALNALSRRLVGDDLNDGMANFSLQVSLGAHVAPTLQYLGEAILTSANPFKLAHGVDLFEYLAKHPEILAEFQNAMAERSQAETGPRLLSLYNGFNTVRSLMDVGGGNGSLLAQIVREYPHINPAINFDLPEVVDISPAYPGVEHVGGDMFGSLPTECDAIIMKKLLHDWDDESCIKILKNCYKALPKKGGKLILVEAILPPENSSAKATAAEREMVLKSSVLMLVNSIGGKERSEHDFHRLVTAAGFRNFQLTVKLDVSYVLEAFK